MIFEDILKVFGEKIGSELVPDASDTVMLDVDDMPLSIIGLKELGLVVLSGVVGEPPPEDRMERLYRAMLEANHNFAGTAGATLSIDADSGNVTLCRALPLDTTDGETFFAEVERFVNTLEVWRKLVSDYRASADEPPSEAGDGPVGGFGGRDEFLQV